LVFKKRIDQSHLANCPVLLNVIGQFEMHFSSVLHFVDSPPEIYSVHSEGAVEYAEKF